MYIYSANNFIQTDNEPCDSIRGQLNYQHTWTVKYSTTYSNKQRGLNTPPKSSEPQHSQDTSRCPPLESSSGESIRHQVIINVFLNEQYVNIINWDNLITFLRGWNSPENTEVDTVELRSWISFCQTQKVFSCCGDSIWNEYHGAFSQNANTAEVLKMKIYRAKSTHGLKYWERRTNEWRGQGSEVKIWNV